MPRRFNASRQYVIPQRIVGHDDLPIADSDQVVSVPRIRSHQGLAVAPGGFWDFSDEEIAAGLASGVEWTVTDLRAGLADEQAWKAERDAKTAHPAKGKRAVKEVDDETNEDTAAADANGDSDSPSTDPAKSGDTEENSN